MKKLTFLLSMAAVLVTAACQQQSDKQAEKRALAALAPCTGNVYKTLNNIERDSALKMIEMFKNKVYGKESLSKLNFWFDISVVQNILALIHNENARGINVDGIRIYFASDLTTPTKVSLILVTTTDSTGLDQAGRRAVLHHDRYEHLCSEDLFKNNLSAGRIYKPGQSLGAKLYSVSNDASGDCPDGTNPHYLKRADAENMVRSFGNDVVNTRAEWFPTSLFEEIVADPRNGGIRIYFATNSPAHREVPNRDAFVITVTKINTANNDDLMDCKHLLFNNNIKRDSLAPPPLDNGSLCPVNCD